LERLSRKLIGFLVEEHVLISQATLITRASKTESSNGRAN